MANPHLADSRVSKSGLGAPGMLARNYEKSCPQGSFIYDEIGTTIEKEHIGNDMAFLP
jgi:hypothetical protein